MTESLYDGGNCFEVPSTCNPLSSSSSSSLSRGTKEKH